MRCQTIMDKLAMIWNDSGPAAVATSGQGSSPSLGYSTAFGWGTMFESKRDTHNKAVLFRNWIVSLTA